MVVADPPRSETKFKFTIRCAGTRKGGGICDQVLCKTTLEDWERIMLAGKIEFKCPRCGLVAEFH